MNKPKYYGHLNIQCPDSGQLIESTLGIHVTENQILLMNIHAFVYYYYPYTDLIFVYIMIKYYLKHTLNYNVNE